MFNSKGCDASTCMCVCIDEGLSTKIANIMKRILK